MTTAINMKPVASAFEISDYLIRFGQECGEPITNLKLQKLLYYAQGWFLGLHDRTLFSASVQAWVRGPVVYDVWKEYSRFQWRPITAKADIPKVPDSVHTHLKGLIHNYWNYSAFRLETMTHQESPWLNARQGVHRDTRSSAVIAVRDMHDYFSKRRNVWEKGIPKAKAI